MRVGLCGWTINAAEYVRTFDTLEVQQTFYEPPSRLTMDRWREQAPPDFVFTIKAWQVITHRASSNTYRRLRSEVDRDECGAFQLNQTVLAAWAKTRECARLLRARAVLFQCPASFRPTDENIANMRRFFDAIERPRGTVRTHAAGGPADESRTAQPARSLADAREDILYLWEPRGPWPDDVIADLCGELRLVHAVDPFLRPSLTPELIYWRLHGIGSHYRPYSDDELRDLVSRLPHDAGERYVMFNNIPRVDDAKRFLTFAAGT